MSESDRVQSAIDEALAELAAVEPSPDFLPRLRAHLERTPPSSVWSRWALPAAVVACALVAAFIVGYDRGARDVTQAPRLATLPTAPTMPTMPTGLAPTALPLTEVAGAREIPAATITHRRIVAPRRALVATPDVLVPASERHAVARLAAALRAGSPDAVSMVGALSAENAEPIPIRPVSVSQIRIEPVVVAPLTVEPPEQK
jgi:hypothetical protein